MNNTFNINRFGNVVRRDGMSYFSNYGWTLVVLWAIPVILWFLTYISMETFDTGVTTTQYKIILKNFSKEEAGVIAKITPFLESL